MPAGVNWRVVEGNEGVVVEVAVNEGVEEENEGVKEELEGAMEEKEEVVEVNEEAAAGPRETDVRE